MTIKDKNRWTVKKYLLGILTGTILIIGVLEFNGEDPKYLTESFMYLVGFTTLAFGYDASTIPGTPLFGKGKSNV